MNFISTSILNLTRQLFPKGRSYWIPTAGGDTDVDYTGEDGVVLTGEDGETLIAEEGTPSGDGFFEKLMKAFGGDGSNRVGTLERFRNDAHSTYDHILPDNDNFTDGTVDPNDNDCNDAERAYGLIQYGVTSALTPTRLQRMATIRVKMAYPGSAAPRQAAGYLQNQLRAAGFDVYVYENIFMPGGVTKTPVEILGAALGSAQHGAMQHGSAQHGQVISPFGTITKVANYIDEAKDATYIIPTYRSIFYIAGATIATFADVPLVRKSEFRQMIIKLKGLHLCGILFIKYT